MNLMLHPPSWDKGVYRPSIMLTLYDTVPCPDRLNSSSALLKLPARRQQPDELAAQSGYTHRLLARFWQTNKPVSNADKSSTT